VELAGEALDRKIVQVVSETLAHFGIAGPFAGPDVTSTLGSVRVLTEETLLSVDGAAGDIAALFVGLSWGYGAIGTVHCSQPTNRTLVSTVNGRLPVPTLARRE
jgi:hypothetical protein